MLQFILVVLIPFQSRADQDFKWQHVSLKFQNPQKKLKFLRISDKKFGSFDIPLKTKSLPPAVIFNIPTYREIILRIQDSVHVRRHQSAFLVELDLPRGNYRATLVYETRKMGGRKFPFESNVFSLYPGHAPKKSNEMAQIENFSYQFSPALGDGVHQLQDDFNL
jgi:hypothetical protein